MSAPASGGANTKDADRQAAEGLGATAFVLSLLAQPSAAKTMSDVAGVIARDNENFAKLLDDATKSAAAKKSTDKAADSAPSTGDAAQGTQPATNDWRAAASADPSSTSAQAKAA